MAEVAVSPPTLPALPRPLLRGVLHQAAFSVSLVIGTLLIVGADGARRQLAAAVFAGSVAACFGASALYHRVTWTPRVRLWMRRIDHAGIYLLIAGTYTPFTLGVMRGPTGWTLFGLIWSLAVFGLTMKAIFGAHHRWLTIPLYLLMGWLAVIAAPQVLFRMPLPALLWLLAGGFAYTAGVLCFKAHRVRYSHFAWHLFVIAGTVCHFFAVLWYSA